MFLKNQNPKQLLNLTRTCLFNLASFSCKYPYILSDHCYDDLLQDAIQVPRIVSDSLVFLKLLVPQVARATFRSLASQEVIYRAAPRTDA